MGRQRDIQTKTAWAHFPHHRAYGIEQRMMSILYSYEQIFRNHGYPPFITSTDRHYQALSQLCAAILPLGKYRNVLLFWQIEAICEKYGASLKTPIKELPDEALNDILNGTDERLNVKNLSLGNSNYFLTFDGLVKYIQMQQQSDAAVLILFCLAFLHQ